MLVSEVMIGAVMAAKLGDEGGMPRGYAAALFVLIFVYVAGYSWSWGPMTWLVPTEVFPLEIRSAGQSTTVASGFVFTIFIAQGFPAMLCWMRAWLFFFFAGWIVVMTVAVAPLMVENGHTAADTASGRPYKRSVTSVMTPSVPSEPTKSRVRSYPEDDLRARPPV